VTVGPDLPKSLVVIAIAILSCWINARLSIKKKALGDCSSDLSFQ
jgi:hypothetical protein